MVSVISLPSWKHFIQLTYMLYVRAYVLLNQVGNLRAHSVLQLVLSKHFIHSVSFRTYILYATSDL